ncbi:MAG: allophanate hydrolase subunit 1, partial [Micromonosporaceae bacterium]|nr:allophanate hydrolase subunit 1 [Micromonosporaceae bacterium]
MRILPCGQRGVLLELDDLARVLALYGELRARPPEGARRISAGARTVLVEFDRPDRLESFHPDRLPTPPATQSTVDDGSLVEIPVRYDGEDLAEVARLTGLSEREVAARHAGGQYRVAFGGFTPGWGYLTGLDPALRLPRHETPRVRVPAGSVAIADEFAGVYPRDSPGGWRILGRTGLAMWDPHRDPPGLLVPGARVRFIEQPAAAPPAPRLAARAPSA